MVATGKRNIPELENVQASRINEYSLTGYLTIRAYYLLELFVIAAFSWLFLNGELRGVSILLTLFILESLYCMRRKSERWETNHDGLTFTRFWDRRFVKWSDVTDVRTKRLFGFHTCIIRSGMATIRIPVSRNLPFLRLNASVWQYLCAVGKSDGLLLPEEASGFWQSIPEDVPDETEWKNPQSQRLLSKAICNLALILLSAILLCSTYFTLTSDTILLSVLICISLYIASAYLCTAFRTAYMVSLKGGILQVVNPLGIHYLNIRDLSDVRWLSGNHLELTENDKRVVIPFTMSGIRTDSLLLAIIKSLRANQSTLVIPIPGSIYKKSMGTIDLLAR